MLCQHCFAKRSNRPHGLCWGCHRTPGVKELYPSTSKFAQYSPVPSHSAAPLAQEATKELPGTTGKIAVMEARALLGNAIFHPHDSQRPL